MNLMNHRSSAIAAAAVLVSFDQRLTKRSIDFKMGVISSCRNLENVSDFYQFQFNLGVFVIWVLMRSGFY